MPAVRFLQVITYVEVKMCYWTFLSDTVEPQVHERHPQETPHLFWDQFLFVWKVVSINGSSVQGFQRKWFLKTRDLLANVLSCEVLTFVNSWLGEKHRDTVSQKERKSDRGERTERERQTQKEWQTEESQKTNQKEREEEKWFLTSSHRVTETHREAVTTSLHACSQCTAFLPNWHCNR